MIVDRMIRRILKSQVYEVTPEELCAWRLSQSGVFVMRNGQECNGWTQARAAAWIGVDPRTWQSWEGEPGLAKSYAPPKWAVRRIVEYSCSLNQKLDQILEGT